MSPIYLDTIEDLLDSSGEVMSGNAVSMKGKLYHDVHNNLVMLYKMLGGVKGYDLVNQEEEGRS